MTEALSLGDSWKKITADRLVALTILVGALGYFVDVFDLLLFSIVRIQSLKDIGVPAEDALAVGIKLLNVQMGGLLLGGFFWGVIGDKFGRLSVLFGSITLYSVANIANAFVQTVPQYEALRFVTGLGLAGELGVGVTLASELLPRALRGLGTTFIATIGVLGATFAAILANVVDWKTAYIIGGIMGILLLILRVNVRESGLFKKMEEVEKKVSRGDFMLFFKNRDIFKRYLAIICIGAPVWGIIGMFISFTPEFAKDFGLAIKPTVGNAVMYCYFGTTAGSFFFGVLSQKLKSRRRAIGAALLSLLLFIALFVTVRVDMLPVYYTLCALLGFGAGYWAMFVQVGAEQFGTNLRATAATSVPNVVRGLVIPITAGFQALTPVLGFTGGALTVMAVIMCCAFAGLWAIRETFGIDLDYIEMH